MTATVINFFSFSVKDGEWMVVLQFPVFTSSENRKERQMHESPVQSPVQLNPVQFSSVGAL